MYNRRRNVICELGKDIPDLVALATQQKGGFVFVSFMLFTVNSRLEVISGRSVALPALFAGRCITLVGTQCLSFHQLLTTGEHSHVPEPRSEAANPGR